MRNIIKIGKNSKLAFEKLKVIDHNTINSILNDYSKSLKKNKIRILKENEKDIRLIKRKNLLDRLILNKDRIESIRHSLNEIIKFKNPIGKVLKEWKRPNKLKIKQITTPIGVIGVIYESRPNVTADVASLCLKSKNCAILRGGSEAFFSNKLLSNLFRESLAYKGVDKNCVQFIENKDRKIVNFLLSSMSDYIDVIVPRGGKNLVKKVQQYSKIHVIGHLEGICHIYLDKSAKLLSAEKIILNAKLRRTSICGALETLLIHEKAIKKIGVPIINSLMRKGCKIIADKKINNYFQNKLEKAREIDWKTEYLAPKLSIKSVKNVNQATAHILKYGTMHTDSIITNNAKTAKIFLNHVNSSIAMHNVSTQFADGGEFGFGGEIGISTNKLPPRGPVGIDQLTSYKYVVTGKNIIRK
tara:strand:+ start:1591 stop:2832 length:1242 start_codon:yes stop_codon:yes gene_type:complete